MSLFYYMTMQAFNFDNLTPDFMWYALESIGVRAESGLLALNSYENRVYQFTDEDRKRYVVKFYRPQRWTPFGHSGTPPNFQAIQTTKGKNGADYRNRTGDLLITSQLLYLLS